MPPERALTIDLAELKEVGGLPIPQFQQRRFRLVLFLASVALGVTGFLTLDWLYTGVIRWTTRKSAVTSGFCRTYDPVRHHSFRPNCTTREKWGKDSYDFFTNSLGFRDERVRQVPLADARPRILLLGDSFTEGKLGWRESYVGRMASHFPKYDFLNGGVSSYSPSNYLNTARMVLAAGVQVDEVIVFIDLSDVQDEAAFYQDVDSSGAVTKRVREHWSMPWRTKWRVQIPERLLLTNYIFEFLDRYLVRDGYYHLTLGDSVFDSERSAWTYRRVNEIDPSIDSYLPLGVECGIARERAKMDLLWQELQKRNIPVSVVVYPYPAQLLHDTPDSRQVRIWRDWCAGKCKRFISLFPAFLAAKDQCPRSQPGCWYQRYFVFGDVHYNATGNALVADAVIKSLEEDPPSKTLERNSGPAPQAAAQ